MMVEVHDNKGQTFDRYTVLIRHTSAPLYADVYGMSENPTHPQGFDQYCCTLPIWKLREQYGWLDRTEWGDLPDDVRRAIEQRLEGYYEPAYGEA